MNQILTLKVCKDKRGSQCFAFASGKCKCLSDTSSTPCPFYKTKAQVLDQDPKYFQRGERAV